MLPTLERCWEKSIETQPAQKRPLDAAAVAAEFSKTRAQAFVTGSIQADITSGIFMPPSQLKRHRREFWEWCAENVTEKDIRDANEARLADIALNIMESPTPLQRGNEETVVLLRPSQASPVPDAITAHEIHALTPQTQEAVLPEFCPEAKLPGLRQLVKKATDSGIRRFRITSIYGLELLRGLPEITVTTSYPLPVCNSAARKALRPYGVRRTVAWVELEEGAANDLLKALGDAGEFLVYARLPLLSTRMEIPVTGEIRDARGGRFVVEHGADTTIILPDKVLAIDPPGACHRFIDLTHAEWGEAATSTFNYPRDWA